MNNYAARSIVVQVAVEKSMGPTLQGFDKQLAAQQRLADQYRFVSPAIVTQAPLLDVAGTSAHRYAHFQRLVDEYHAEWRAFFFSRIFARAQRGHRTSGLARAQAAESLRRINGDGANASADNPGRRQRHQLDGIVVGVSGGRALLWSRDGEIVVPGGYAAPRRSADRYPISVA